MTLAKPIAAFAVALLWLSLPAGPAQAQFGIPGLVNYPNNDFKWVWGRERELTRRGFEDFSLGGYDGGFQCTLTGKLGPGSRITDSEVRAMENDLRTSSFFIQDAANAMYVLDQQRQIDWAELDCVKHVDDADAAELQEREDKARAKAERDRERRRARAQRDAD